VAPRIAVRIMGASGVTTKCLGPLCGANLTSIVTQWTTRQGHGDTRGGSRFTPEFTVGNGPFAAFQADEYAERFRSARNAA
jgi:hypothetical protein